MNTATHIALTMLAVLVATAGMASGDHDVPTDPFSDEEPLFTDDDEEDPFEQMLQDAPETIPEADGALNEDDDEDDDPPPPPDEDTNDAPAPSPLALLALLGLTAARRRA